MNVLDAMTQRLFDYAGMFPPAALSLEDAVRTSKAFPEVLERPELVDADLVLTPTAWRELDDHLPSFGRPCTVCLVGIPVEQGVEIAKEALDWNDGVARPPRVVSTLELHFDDTGHVAQHIAAVQHVTDARIFIEPKWDDATWSARFDDLMDLLDTLNADVELPPVGLKFRCWGDTALAPQTVARVLRAIDERAIPLKATQGLHHALVAGHEQNVIGFVGLVAALRMCEAGLDVDLVEVMTESDPDAFTFEGHLGWRGHEVALSALGAERVPLRIGTCSLDEPDQELAALPIGS